jgi:hypothetical protein
MCTEQPPREASAPKPSIEALQRDIEFANTYRLEKLKTLLAVTTALLAFTVSFRPKLVVVELEWSMVMGWIGLSLALLTGIATMHAWEQFYISYRDYDWKGKSADGKRHRKVITRWRRVLFACQCIGFLVGVAGIAIFAAANVDHVQAQHEAGNGDSLG